MPAEFWRCRFFGGYNDGLVIMIWTRLMTSSGVIEMPIAQDYQAVMRLWAMDPAERLLVPDFGTELYRWDGTVNEAGERRMRWVP